MITQAQIDKKRIEKLEAENKALITTLKTLVDLHDELPSMLTAEDWEKARRLLSKVQGE